ncbi:MAG TPA: hypothetical protein VLL48_10395, partial [Longimicrobiales bacterium]|nr:hypothetical protein [Longimicrobiales bacterium]
TTVSALFAGNGVDGPLVAPGEYRVELAVDGILADSRPLQVLPDPDAPVSASRLAESRAAQMTLYTLHRTVLEASAALEAVAEAVEELGPALSGRPRRDAAVALRDSIDTEVERIRRALGSPGGGGRGRGTIASRAGFLEAQLLRSSLPPTAWELAAIQEVRADAADAVRRVNDVILQKLPPLARGAGRSVPSIAPVREPDGLVGRR